MFLAVASFATTGAQQPRPTAAHEKLPPVSFTCPMDPDIVEDKPGTCPRCKMTLEPIRLDTAYACPTHTNEIPAVDGKVSHRREAARAGDGLLVFHVCRQRDGP